MDLREYDADGNQTLVTTATGRWRVEYDGENRPVRWTREDDGKTVTMSYDHLGRRRRRTASGSTTTATFRSQASGRSRTK